MRVLRILLILFYFCLTLFINNGEILAYENFEQSISQVKNETKIINKKEEYYTIFQNRNRVKITNLSNKNDKYNIDGFSNIFFTLNNLLFENIPTSIYISHNISPYLKNEIYTRAP